MLREHGIEIDESLEIPPCPAAFDHLMLWYDELRAWSQQGFQGVAPLSWSDVHAWRVEMEIIPRPRPSEYRLLMRIDTLFRNACAKAKPAEKPGRDAAPR